ncbi:hypothetical protein [Sphaerimonospora thailandensis]|uniref:Uncharacterized protein n=1 Tax=Sphaerimonospora thailandensis TaxID=795644 RepID=A0A8J3VYI3_9ACTN|nr:hypothetical protein [Sphaerimonospora thailandensis]GIH69467.1 hypothetical protein Mth01_17200 [Sphaerimonospora thailandensis]
MTPQRLHSALNARRRERGLTWDGLAAELGICAGLLDAMRRGVISGETRARALAWLEDDRRQVPPREE